MQALPGHAEQSVLTADPPPAPNPALEAEIESEADASPTARTLTYANHAFVALVAEDFDEYLKRQRNDSEWGDHVEIVALRELFNKNVEVYDMSSVKAPNETAKCAKMTTIKPKAQTPHGYRRRNSPTDTPRQSQFSPDARYPARCRASAFHILRQFI